MGPWRLELVRIWRTRRLVALGVTFLLVGLAVPVLTYYLPALVRHAAGGVTIIAPRQTPADAIQGFAANAAQLGTLVVVVVAAATLAFDSHPALAAFYRTRLRAPGLLVLPRYLAVTGAVIAALTAGTLAAWYETTVLIGHVSPAALAGGLALQALWLCFTTAVVALFCSAARGPAAVVGGSIALLLSLALVGNLQIATSWLPTRLAESGADLVTHHTGGAWHAVLVTTAATLAALALAVHRLGGRELQTASSRPH